MLPFRTLEGGRLSQFRFTADPSIVYAVNLPWPPLGPPALVKSSDGGLTWNAPVASRYAADSPYYLFVDPRSSTRLLCSDYRHLYFSSDGGQSFTQVHATRREGGLLVSGAYFGGRDIYVATNDGVLASHDNGLSYAPDASLDAGLPEDESIVSFASAEQNGRVRFLAVTFRNRDIHGHATVTADTTAGDLDLFSNMYRLTLGQSGWIPASSGLAPNEKLAMVAMSPDDVDVAYAAGGARIPAAEDPDAGMAPVIVKTVDGGTTWRSTFLSEHNANIATGWSGDHGDMGWHFGEYALGLAVSAHDPDRVVFTDLGFVHVSSDGGAHWRQAYVHSADQNPIGRDTPKSHFYRSNGVEQTSGWWLTWSDRNTLFASLTDIRSAFSRDGGVSWTRDANNGLTLNTTYHVVVDQRTGRLYAATSSVHDIYQSPYLRDSRLDATENKPRGGAVMVSSDQGATWSLVHDFQRPVVWLAQDPNRPADLYASVVSSQTGGIYRLDLSNPSRAPAALPEPPRTKGHPFNVYVLHDGSILATYSGHQDGDSRVFSNRSGVFLLPPGSSEWEDRSSPRMHYWTQDVVVDPRNEDSWYVGVFSDSVHDFGGLYRTRDRGMSWQRISARYRVESCAIDPKDPKRLYMTTQGEGLWVTEDLDQKQPVFRPVDDYPFQQPLRVFWNPFDTREVWTVSFGGGMRMRRESSTNRAERNDAQR
ncbi:MAG: hypothetical protein JW940_34640 [Polyangiaceae bacterium]|nr:hypothetical protein [Polyangiaceae bacterium]